MMHRAGWARVFLLGLLLVATLSEEAAAGTKRETLRVGRVVRTYVLHVPASSSSRVHSSQRRRPVVLVFHGAGSDVRSMVRATHFNALAENEDFLVAYPEAVGGRFDAGAGGRRGARPLPDDMAFVRALLDHLRRTYAVDERRIYATGFSNGGMFCYRLAAEMSGRIAAIAPVAAAMGNEVRTRPTTPVSVLHVHGSADRRVPFGRAGEKRARYRSVPDTIRIWAAWDGCREKARVDRLAPTPKLRMERRWHHGKRPGVDVGLLKVQGVGHAWPMGGQDWTTRSIWAFFKAHPKPLPPQPVSAAEK